MIKPTELKIGVIVKHENREYTIIETNAEVKIDGLWFNCIVYAPNYENDCNLFIRKKTDFVNHFDVVK